MPDAAETVTFDRSAQMVFIAPYWTSELVTGAAPERRPKVLESMRAALNGAKKDGPWQVERFTAPRTMRFRKYGQVWRRIPFTAEFEDRIAQLVGPEHFGGLFGRVTYFDYGLGAVEAAARIDNISGGNLRGLASGLAEAKQVFVAQMVAGLPDAELDMAGVDRDISRFLRQKEKAIPNGLRPSYPADIIPGRAAAMCGPVSRNLLFIDSGGGMERTEGTLQDLAHMANVFLNEISENRGVTNSRRMPVSHVGFEGAVALVRRRVEPGDAPARPADDFPTACMAESGEVARTKRLWSAVQLYWSALFCASEGLYAQTARHPDLRGRGVRQLSADAEALEEYQGVISMIRFESRPEKIVVEGEDRIRYSEIWDAYNGDELIAALSQIQTDLERTIESMRDRAQKLIRSRMNMILTAFTLLTVLSVVVDVIMLYDVEGRLGPVQRMIILGEGAALLAVIGLGALALSATLPFTRMAEARKRRRKRDA